MNDIVDEIEISSSILNYSFLGEMLDWGKDYYIQIIELKILCIII